MNYRYGRPLAVLCLVAAGSLAAQAQVSAATLQRLASPVDTIRVHAFYALRAAYVSPENPRISRLFERAQQDRQLADALIALLRRENQLMRAAGPAAAIDPEDMMDYRLDLSGTVAAMRDPASVDELLPWVSTGGIVRDALISFGDISVPGLVTTLADIEWTQRMAAALTLDRIAGDTTRSMSAPARDAIRAGLLRLLNSNELIIEVRLHCVYALASFADDDVRATMERLAASDTTTSSAYRVRYPVREAAKAWLTKHSR